MIGAFLEHLETDRGNSPRTRNVRLAAIHSFFQLLRAAGIPSTPRLIARVLAIPAKRSENGPSRSCTPKRSKRCWKPGPTTWAGRRDHALLLCAVQTGLRVSELIALTYADVQLGTGAHLRTFGKGTQGEGRTAHQPDRRRAQGLDPRARRPSQPTRCSRPAPAGRSRATRSNAVSPNTSTPPRPAARRCAPSACQCTRCATPPR